MMNEWMELVTEETEYTAIERKESDYIAFEDADTSNWLEV